jgi:hypothetical protein
VLWPSAWVIAVAVTYLNKPVLSVCLDEVFPMGKLSGGTPYLAFRRKASWLCRGLSMALWRLSHLGEWQTFRASVSSSVNQLGCYRMCLKGGGKGE